VDLVVRRFDNAGAPLTGEILVRSLEDARSPDERSVSLACDPSGNFVLAWIERSASITWNVWAQRFDSNAVPLAAEFLVSNVVGDNLPSQVDVAVNASGAFAVAWNTFIGYLRQYDASGAPVSPPSYLQLDGEVGCMGAPSVAIDASGRVLVISGCGGSDGQPDGSGVIAWEFDAAGAPLADAARVNTSRLGDQRFPVAAIAPDGDFLVVWTNAEPEPRVLGGQFFCDPADAECDICPGHDDSADADGDGIPDGCDPCTNVDGGSGSGQPAKLVLRRLETPGWPFGQSSSRASLKLVADFTTAAPAAFSSIDPVADGIHVLVSASDGGSVVDAHLPAGAYTPGGAGWRSNRTGTKWFYRDKTATPTRGIVKAVLIDRGDKAGPGSVRAKVRGKRSIYPAMTTSDPPMSLTVVLGDDTGALAGSCGQSGFTGAQCEANLDHPAISCRK
jgi:hypothetical protein